MFGSSIAAKVIYGRLVAQAGLTAVVGQRIFHANQVPQGQALPACLFYMESSSYDGPVGAVAAEHINAESMTWTVKVLAQSASLATVEAAALAQLTALAGESLPGDGGAQVTFIALGEVPLPSFIEDGVPYRQLGTIYQVEVTTGS